GPPVPLMLTVGNTSAWENCNPNAAGYPFPRVCGTNKLPSRTTKKRNACTRDELKVYTSDTWALYPSAALFSQPIGQTGPGSMFVLCGLSCMLTVMLTRFLSLML